jgi:CxxC motif-containing protein
MIILENETIKYDDCGGKDVFTTIIRVKGSGKFNVIPVKSNKPIEKDLWIECSKALSRLRVGPPLKIGDVVCKNILNTGIDIVCTRNINRK